MDPDLHYQGFKMERTIYIHCSEVNLTKKIFQIKKNIPIGESNDLELDATEVIKKLQAT